MRTGHPSNIVSQAPPRKAHRWPWVVAIPIALIVGVGIGGSGDGRSTRPTEDAIANRAQPAPTVTVTVAGQPNPTRTVAESGAEMRGPELKWTGSIPGDGIFVVGTDVRPGTYQSGPAAGSSNCFWQRLSDTSGGLDAFIAGDISSAGPIVVRIRSSDKAFRTTGCMAWVKVA